MTNENKKRFLFFGLDKDYFLLLRISIHNGELGSRSSLWKNFLKKTICSNMLISLFFNIWKFCIFFSNLIEKRRY